MSHGDSIVRLPANAVVEATTESIPVAAFRFRDEDTYGIQFHPEVVHSEHGTQLLRNFVYEIAGCSPSWTPASFIDESVASLKSQIGEGKVVLGLSGGVDSTVAATLLDRAIGNRLHGNAAQRLCDAVHHLRRARGGQNLVVRQISGQTCKDRVTVAFQLFGEPVEGRRDDVRQYEIVRRTEQASAGSPHPASGACDQNLASCCLRHVYSLKAWSEFMSIIARRSRHPPEDARRS
jgi:hypothetical protein